MRIEPIRLHVRSSPVDLLILGLVAIALAWCAITYSELDDLRRVVQRMELR